MKQTPVKKWRVVFALDCHGGVLVPGENEVEARKNFELLDVDEVFKEAQVKKLRFLGVVSSKKKL